MGTPIGSGVAEPTSVGTKGLSSVFNPCFIRGQISALCMCLKPSKHHPWGLVG